MKYFPLLIIICVTTICSCGQSNSYVEQTDKTILEDEVLNGRIKIIREKHIYNNGIDSLTYTFNESGTLISILEESESLGGLNKKAISSFNSESQIVRYTNYDEDGKETDYIEYFYKDGNLIKRFYKHGPSTPIITRYFDYELDIYKYDDKGNLIESKSSSKQKKSIMEQLEEHIKYRYDSIGDCIMEEELDRRGNVIKRKNHKYYNHQLIETLTWMEFEGTDLYYKDIYEYNIDSTMKSHKNIVYDYGGTEVIVKSWSESYNYEYDYDETGKILGETKITLQDDKPVKKESWRYMDFDKNGNWITKEVNKVLYTREIEYYEE